MVPMEPEGRELSRCLQQIFGGDELVSFDHLVHLVSLDPTFRPALAEALRPLLQRLEVAEVAQIPAIWRSLEKASWLLSDFGDNELVESIMAAARDVLAGRATVAAQLVEQHLLRLQRFRTDPLSTATALTERSRFSEILADLPPWKEKVEIFQRESVAKYELDCAKTLETVAKGASCELWAHRLSSSVQVEQVIDQHCPGRFAAACAVTWLQQSLPPLPWLLLHLLLPAMKLSKANHQILLKLRKALECCDDPEALGQLRDALVNACSLLLRTAWCQSTEIDYAEAVRWFSSALVVTHEACQLLLPELPVTSVAAALAATPLAQPPPGAPWETSTTSTSSTSPVMEALAEALAVAVHEEMSCWGEGAAWPGKMAPLLLLFRILPDAGGSPLQAQARLIALRALQQEARCLEHRLLEFLQNECGHQHPVLRHLAKVLHDADADADGAAMGPLGFRAVAVPQLAVAQLGLAERGPRFPVPVTSVAKVLESQQLHWEELYRKKFPHRRLQWTSLGAVQLLWRHRKGETLLIATERQGHVLLAVDEGGAFECEAKEDTWHELLPLQQVLTAEECPVARLDLRVVPRGAAPVVQELTSRSSQSAAVVDAALVRLLKRFHVLTGEEILRKLSQYPESLELGAELCGPKAFSDARAAAQDDGREAFQRLCALCDRGLLREETQELGGNTLTLAGSKAVETPLQPGEFLQRRFFYET